MSVTTAFTFTLILNLMLAFSKMIIGFLVAWPSLISDGLHTLSDGLTNVVALGSIRFARKPKDENHPYGHGRIESLAMLVIVAFLVYLSIEVLLRGINQVLNPVLIEYHPLMMIILGVSLIVNGCVVGVKYTTGKAHQHRLLLADAQHSLADVLSTLFVAIGAVLIIGFDISPRVDGVMSMLIAILIFKIAVDVFKESAKELLDEAVIDPSLIEEMILQHPLVHSIHEVRSRQSGKTIYVDFHAQCDPDLSLLVTHTLVHELEVMIQKHLGEHVHVIVHVEPLGFHYHKSKS